MVEYSVHTFHVIASVRTYLPPPYSLTEIQKENILILISISISISIPVLSHFSTKGGGELIEKVFFFPSYALVQSHTLQDSSFSIF